MFLPLQYLLHYTFVFQKMLDLLWHFFLGTTCGFAVGAWVPVSQLAEEEVNAYRQLEEERISKVLDDLLDICKSQKVETMIKSSLFYIWSILLAVNIRLLVSTHQQPLAVFLLWQSPSSPYAAWVANKVAEKNSQVNASKIIFSCDDIARGLLQLVDDHGITDLVMGAASDKAYSRYGCLVLGN